MENVSDFTNQTLSDLHVINGALHNSNVYVKLTMSACCQKKAPGKVSHSSPPAAAPPDTGHLWVGRGSAPHCAAGPPQASRGQ